MLKVLNAGSSTILDSTSPVQEQMPFTKLDEASDEVVWEPSSTYSGTNISTEYRQSMDKIWIDLNWSIVPNEIWWLAFYFQVIRVIETTLNVVGGFNMFQLLFHPYCCIEKALELETHDLISPPMQTCTSLYCFSLNGTNYQTIPLVVFLSEWAKVMREIQPVVLSFLQLPYHFASTSLAVFFFFVHLFVYLLCSFFVLSFPCSFRPFFLPFFVSFLYLYLCLSSLSVSLTTKTIFKLQLTPTSLHFWSMKILNARNYLKRGSENTISGIHNRPAALLYFFIHHGHRSH